VHDLPNPNGDPTSTWFYRHIGHGFERKNGAGGEGEAPAEPGSAGASPSPRLAVYAGQVSGKGVSRADSSVGPILIGVTATSPPKTTDTSVSGWVPRSV